MPELRLGSQGAEVGRFYDYFYGTDTRKGYAEAYKILLGKRDLYYGGDEERFTKELQRRLVIPITGKFGDLEAAKTGYRWSGTSTPPAPVKNEVDWIWSAPGSGAPYWIGPSHELGERLKNERGFNHQPTSFIIGGYLGFLGGDPKNSYLEVTWDHCKSLEWLWDHNPRVQKALELANAGNIAAAKAHIRMWLSGYSQSADAIEDALEWLCTPGFVHPGDKTQTPSDGRYAAIRDCIVKVVQFGNPSTVNTGIARKVRSSWLAAKIRNVNKPNDFYAVVPVSDKIRPAFYRAIIEAEMELPFFVHCMMIALPIVMQWAAMVIPVIGPMLGGMFGNFGPMMQMGMGLISGLGGVSQSPLMGQFMGMAGSGKDQHVHDDLLAILSPTGVLQNIPGLIGLIAALPGLQAHGMYGLEDVQAAFDLCR